MVAAVAESTGKVLVDLTRARSRGDAALRERPLHQCGLRTIAIANQARRRGIAFQATKKQARCPCHDLKSFARKRKLTFSRVWPVTRASPNACGTNMTGSVFFSNRTTRPSSTCSYWKNISTIRNAIRSSPGKWVGRNYWTSETGARKGVRCGVRRLQKRALPAQIGRGHPTHSKILIALEA